ncbi:DNA repair protein RadC [Bombella sp. TMW 2.2559]|uniref:DNA repair protein RadC n=1 Tax=Bombella dulcis TaxID=2967339 RepID=A0ABT3W9G2_9PROT|nr:DNA repair protein RadC [Bombella dulcis]MCX5615732.1 DNA repair protein RadC [Bombella dulcis]
MSEDDAQEKLTNDLLKYHSSLSQLIFSQPSDRSHIPKDNVSLAVFCIVLKELAHRYGRSLLPEGDLLEQPELLRDYLMVHMARERVEQFRLLFLDGKNHLIRDEVQGRGTINHVPVYPREIAKRCLELKAAGIIMVHNHPAGQPNPSRGDIIMTQNIEMALKVIEVKLIDHLIITKKAQTSFRQLGLLGAE